MIIVLLALFSAGTLDATTAVPVGLSCVVGQIKAQDGEAQDWSNHESQSPLATMQEAAPLGHLSLRPQRNSNFRTNVLSRGGGKFHAGLTFKHLDKARWSAGSRVESSPCAVMVSSDYYVIALRHIIR